MKKIAIVGANGFVGKALVRTAKDFDFDISCVTRQNYDDYKKRSYDYVINTAMPSKRFWSLKNPVDDINETVLKTAKIFYEWEYDKFIQVSSISAEKQLDIPYGRHKRAAEVIVEKDENALIVRLGAMYGDGLLKSALFDLVNKNHIYVDINSEYNYINVDYAAKYILNNLHLKGIHNIGACDSISLLEISKNVWENPSYEGRLERLVFNEINDSMPSSREVLKYVDSLKTGDTI